jgi:hypothetical protein
MLGGYLVILWLSIFSIVSYVFSSMLKLKTALLRTIFVWTFCMIFVGIFELLLLFYYEYLQNKGKYYYKNNNCYWSEDNSILDMFSYKMYMDLYADYSLCDKRYCKKIINQGSRFVILGELTHGFFCLLLAPIILYYFINFNELYIYLLSIIFVAIQFGLIIWYLASVFVEMYFVKNDKFWCPPLLWNVPWVIVPLYVIYYGIIEIINLKTEMV